MAGAATAMASAPAGAWAQQDTVPKVGDPASTHKVYLVILALSVLAICLTIFTVWYWRSTRPEPHALGRLEMMSAKRWNRADYMNRKDLLDHAHDFVGGDGPLAEYEEDEYDADEDDRVGALARLARDGDVDGDDRPASRANDRPDHRYDDDSYDDDAVWSRQPAPRPRPRPVPAAARAAGPVRSGRTSSGPARSRGRTGAESMPGDPLL